MSTGHTTSNQDDQNNPTFIQIKLLASKVQPKSVMKQFFVITLSKLKYIFFYQISGVIEEDQIYWAQPLGRLLCGIPFSTHRHCFCVLDIRIIIITLKL
jgi:hypothetical protein